MSLPGGCLVVRTYFGDQEAWERLMAAVQQPDSDDGYVATVTFVDDPSSTAMSADDLRAQVADNPESPMVSFIADERAQRAKGSPLLAVWVAPPDPELDTSDYAPFRVIASELSTVEVNINLGNLDWDDFAGAVDADGVYRGSNNEDHNASTEWWQRGTYEFQTIVDRLLDPARRPARASLLTDVVLADVVIEASKQTALRRWRDIDSAWIADGVNPTGPSPHTYRLHHR
jgi:hypothetical protein